MTLMMAIEKAKRLGLIMVARDASPNLWHGIYSEFTAEDFANDDWQPMVLPWGRRA